MKQVPASSKVDIDPETGAMKRMSGETRTNPYDLFALETALQIREKVGGTVTVLTMGPPQAEEMMRDAYTMGADDAVILSDRKFAGADVLATSYALAQGIQVIGGADLIIGGHPHVVQPARMLMAEDGREVPVFYSLGNFLSHQMSAEQMLGGMASLRLVKDDAGTRVEDAELLPTVTVITHKDTGWWSYRPMLLSDYTDELAAQHRLPEASPEYLWGLYNKISGKEA